MSKSSSQSKVQVSGYYDLIVRGMGYLSRVRLVKSKGSAPQLWCSVCAVRGNADPEDRDYSYFDLRVVGEEAKELIPMLKGHIEAGRKVFISFSVGDIYADPYQRRIKVNGVLTGETEPAALIKGRLLAVSRAWADGEVVFEKPSQVEGENASQLGKSQSQAEVSPAKKAAVPSQFPAAGAEQPRDRTKIRSYAEAA